MKLFILCLFVLKLDQENTDVTVTSYKLKGKTATGHFTGSINEPFVAVSRDLLSTYPLGTYIYLSNCKWEGLYKVLDKMGKRKTNSMDVFSFKSNTGHVKCTCSSIK